MNHDKVSYFFDDLKLAVKQFRYYNKSKYFKSKILKILKICFCQSNNNFVKYLMLQDLYINNYYNLNSYFFFKEKNNLNLIKFNRFFNIFLLRASCKLITFNLDIWYDWYDFNFSENIISYCNLKIKLTKKERKAIKDFKDKKIAKWINIVFKYKKRIIYINTFFKKKFKGIMYFRLNFRSFFKIKINLKYKKLLNYYVIKFSESSLTKHINAIDLKKYKIQYLRKNRIFNKGRYSRNRQLYRTGVYWCLWLNIIMVYGLYFMFYRFTFNFGYFWWGILFLCYSTIFSRIAKYNFYSVFYLYKEFYYLAGWYGNISLNLYDFLKSMFMGYFRKINIYNYIANYRGNNLNFIYNDYYYYLIKYVKEFIQRRKRIKIVFLWQGMKEKDTSFLRYKTVLHWIKELYRLIIT